MDYLIQTDKFHNIIFRKYLVRKLKPKDQTIRILLSYYLSLCCETYPKEDEFNLFLQNAYDMRYNVNVTTIGSYSIMTFTLKAIDPKYLNDKSYTYKFLENAFNICMRPLIINDNFDIKTFKQVKDIYCSNLLYFNENEAKKAQNKAISHYFKGTIRDFSSEGNIDELKQITCKKLYNYYKKIINDEASTYVVGDVDNIYKVENHSTITPKYNHFFKKRGICEEFIIEEANTSQAYLHIIYDAKIFTNDKLFYPLTFINYLFGGCSNSKLFTIVREKYGLCYSIYSTHMGASGIILVSAIINKKDLKQALEKIDEAFNSILNDINLEEIKKHYILEKKGRDDYIGTRLNDHFMDTSFPNTSLSYMEEDLINKVTMSDIKKAYKKLKKSFVYVMGGDLDE